MDLHHPLVQSLVLPLAIAFIAAGVLRFGLGATHGPRWAGAALGLALLAAGAWMLGWRTPPGSLVEKLPWVFAAAWALGLVLTAVRVGRVGSWVAASVLWLAVLWWLGGRDWLVAAAATAVLGAGVLAALFNSPPERANAAALLVVAGLGLAGVAMEAGSLVLFQSGILLAAAVGGVALWVWPVARIQLGAAALVAAGVAWLTLAQATLVLTSAPPVALLLLVGVFWVEPLARRVPLPGPRALVEPLATAVLAAVLAAAAVGLTMHGGGDAPANGDDAYYQPKW